MLAADIQHCATNELECRVLHTVAQAQVISDSLAASATLHQNQRSPCALSAETAAGLANMILS